MYDTLTTEDRNKKLSNQKEGKQKKVKFDHLEVEEDLRLFRHCKKPSLTFKV
jgi:hypothetical protein